MNALRLLLSALAGATLLAPLAATAAQSQPAEPAPPSDAQQQAEPQAEASPAADEDKRICRHVKLDAASRRKTKVCRTVAEWRELNNIR